MPLLRACRYGACDSSAFGKLSQTLINAAVLRNADNVLGGRYAVVNVGECLTAAPVFE